MEIRKIDANATYPIRQLVLRPGKSLDTCHFEGDFLDSTMHFGIFVANNIVGILSLFSANNSIFEEKFQMQIRGMAILDNFQNKGYGALLVNQAEKMAGENNCTLIWFNAREKAVPFYKKLGYLTVGNMFEIATVGPHFVMYKKYN